MKRIKRWTLRSVRRLRGPAAWGAALVAFSLGSLVGCRTVNRIDVEAEPVLVVVLLADGSRPVGIAPPPARHGGEPSSTHPLAVSGQWERCRSPYRVQANLIVPTNATLTVEPGVQVVFDPPFHLQVAGTLLAQGSASRPIVFTASDPAAGWGGIRLLDTMHSNSLRHVVLEHGRACAPYAPPYHGPDMEGAGVYVQNSRLAMEHCVLRNHRASVHGSALSVRDASDIVVDRCRFVSNSTINSCAGYGAIVYESAGANPVRIAITGCEIAHNTSPDEAAGISIAVPGDEGPVLVANNVFHHNLCHGRWAPGTAGVARFAGGRILNNVFWRNTLAQDAAGPNPATICLRGSTVFANNIVWDNDTPGTDVLVESPLPSFFNNLVSGAEPEHAGSLKGDPGLRDPAGNDFRLRQQSPCIDAGEDRQTTPTATDFYGNDRISGRRVDIGAAEYIGE
jgi:hypothetical protein